MNRLWVMILLTGILLPRISLASESFQFSPPPFPILNLRSVDAQNSTSLDYIGLKVGEYDFKAGNFGFGRMVRYWDSGGLSASGNYQIIYGQGTENFGGTSADMSLFGPGFGFGLNALFDLAGTDEDGFSLPFYFGPHVNYSGIYGSFSYSYRVLGTTYSDTIFVNVQTLLYGWQAGLQMGVNLGPFKLIPYLDFAQELGGTTLTTTTGSSSSTSSSLAVERQAITTSPGFDLMIRPWGLSVGAVSQSAKEIDDSNSDVKTTIYHLRFQKKFVSICGL